MDNMEKLIEVVNEYKGKIVFVEYYRNPNAEDIATTYCVISGLTGTHLEVVTAVESSLTTEFLPIPGIELIAENHHARRGEAKVLYSKNINDNDNSIIL